MPNPYSEIFQARGSKGFAAAGFVARLPIAMADDGHRRHAFADAWRVLAGRRRLGHVRAHQRIRVAADLPTGRPLRPEPRAHAGHGAFRRRLRGAPAGDALSAGRVWTLFVSALLAAAMPSMPAMVRARWTELYRDTPKLGTAFAFESVADEVVYMTGSILSVGLSVTLFPEAGPLASTIFLAVGTVLFVMQKSTEPQGPARRKDRRPLGHRLRPVQIYHRSRSLQSARSSAPPR